MPPLSSSMAAALDCYLKGDWRTAKWTLREIFKASVMAIDYHVRCSDGPNDAAVAAKLRRLAGELVGLADALSPETKEP